MPTYDYQCKTCGYDQEIVHRMSEDPEILCDCGEQMVKTISSDFQVNMQTTRLPKKAPSTGSGVSTEEGGVKRIPNKMSEKAKMDVMRQRYAHRNAVLERMCEGEEYKAQREKGEINPGALKKMFSSGMVNKTPKRSELDKPKQSK